MATAEDIVKLLNKQRELQRRRDAVDLLVFLSTKQPFSREEDRIRTATDGPRGASCLVLTAEESTLAEKGTTVAAGSALPLSRAHNFAPHEDKKEDARR